MKQKHLFIGAALIAVLIVAAALFMRQDPPDPRIVAALTDVGATDIQRWYPNFFWEPHAYTDAYSFGIYGSEGGGRLFRCATKQDCDTLIADSNPHAYRSANGTTVVTVGDFLEARAAVRFADAIRDLP
jgi:hypothetical protein